jgi:hypothetical protein
MGWEIKRFERLSVSSISDVKAFKRFKVQSSRVIRFQTLNLEL